MGFKRDTAADAAKKDLSGRLGIDPADIRELAVTEEDFPDMSLGAAVDGEMSAQMISSGWKIELGVNGDRYEYRADKYQLRLVGFQGQNYVVQ